MKRKTKKEKAVELVKTVLCDKKLSDAEAKKVATEILKYVSLD